MEPSNKDHEAQEYYDRGNTFTSQASDFLAWECEVFPKVRTQVQSLAVTTVHQPMTETCVLTLRS